MDVDLGGALFADGAGAYNVIATLPLAEGYYDDVPQFRRAEAEGRRSNS